MFLSDLCKGNIKLLQNGIFERLWIGLFLLLRTNLENISQILIFADLDLPLKLDDVKIFRFTVLTGYTDSSRRS